MNDRVVLARAAYEVALRNVRERSMPATWRRLVRASQNLRDAAVEIAAQPHCATLAALRRRSVLLVEDERETRDALRDILADRGLVVFTAQDGPGALDLVGRLSYPPSVIVLDLVLPGMSGHELRWKLLHRPALANVPVLAMSALRGPRVPSDTFFQKPFEVALFVDTVARLVAHA